MSQMTDERRSDEIKNSFIDDPKAPTWFVDEVAGGWYANGALRITVAAAHVNHIVSAGPVNLVVIGRLMMSPTTAEAFIRALQNGIDKARALDGPAAATLPDASPPSALKH